MKIAVISDIHGNTVALQEVFRDIESKGVEMIINLGDSLYGPLDPKGTYELLNSNNIISISGNEDRIILENLDNVPPSETLKYVKSQIDKSIMDWLENLQFSLVWKEIYCCHGTPECDSDYLLENIGKNGISIKDTQEIDKILVSVKQKIIVCGHSHISGIVQTNNKLIVNPGSVGLPAYDDDFPAYHKMQNYNPRANYAILDISENSISVDRHSIDYDFEKAARLATENNRPDWAKWLRTGLA